MRRMMLSVVVLALLGAFCWGQVEAPAPPKELTCPVDGFKFAFPPFEPGDRAGGSDSDMCPHDIQGQTLPGLVVVCPRCNFTASLNDFENPLKPEQRQAELKVLASSKYRGVTDTLTEIPSWDRFVLAARCASVLPDPAGMEAEYYKYAGWCARIQATRPATVAYGQLSPLAVDDAVKMIQEKTQEAETKPEKARQQLYLAMIYERAGYAARRDAGVAELEKEAGSDAALKDKIDDFKRLVGIERGFQEKFLELARKRLEKTTNRDERMSIEYVVADTERRLGKDAEALADYRIARKLMIDPVRSRMLRSLTDHFLSMLAPGEPVPIPEETPEPKPTAETPAPETPKPEEKK